MKLPPGILALGVLLAASAMSAAAGPVAAEPAATRFQIGKFEAFSLRDASNVVPNDGSVFGAGDATPAEVAQVLKAAGAPTDTLTLSVSALLVRLGKRVVLIDTGLGPKVSGVLLQSLAKAGIAPADVTDVLITHEHGDHIGGLLTADGRSAFPNATIRFAAAEWSHMQGEPSLAALVKAVTPQVKTFEAGATVIPGITAVQIKGHTLGHTGYEIVSGQDRLLDIGDAAHSSIVSLAKPGWAVSYDADKDLAKQSRGALLTRLSANHERVFSPHFPYPGVGTVEAAGDHFGWQPTLKAAL